MLKLEIKRKHALKTHKPLNWSRSFEFSCHDQCEDDAVKKGSASATSAAECHMYEL